MSYFQHFMIGTPDARKPTDEVARNGAFLKITSARGFLERPLLFQIKPSEIGSSSLVGRR
jgi:hypothetical protein